MWYLSGLHPLERQAYMILLLELNNNYTMI